MQGDPVDVSGSKVDAEPSNVSVLRRLAELSAAAAAGGYAWFQGDLLHWNRWRSGVEDADLALALLLMGVAGLVLGAVSRLPGWVVGLVTAALPILRIPIDVIEDPTSHNLVPFEVAIYLSVSAPAVAAAVVLNLLCGRAPFGAAGRGSDSGPV